jgi:hypothetical protein
MSWHRKITSRLARYRSGGALVVLIAATLFIPAASFADSLEIAVQDDASLIHADGQTRQQALAMAQNLGANWIRVNDYPDADLSTYDAGINDARSHGFQVEMTLVCKGNWSAQSFKAHASAVTQHFGGAVHRYSICNEPNYPGWMSPIGGKSLAATYRSLYVAGRDGIKAVDPSAQVLFGELSSKYNPIQFMNDALCMNQGGCGGLMVDGIAYHPYQQMTNPRLASASEVGIGSLDRINQAIDRAYYAGAAWTPGGGRPDIYLTEFGYQSLARGNLASRNLSASNRASWLPAAFDQACRTPHVKQMLQYQLMPSGLDWGGSWDTSIVQRDGQPDASYLALKQWVESTPQCVAR